MRSSTTRACRWETGAASFATTMISSVTSRSVSIICSINVRSPHDRCALSRPMRRLSPPAKMTPVTTLLIGDPARRRETRDPNGKFVQGEHRYYQKQERGHICGRCQDGGSNDDGDNRVAPFLAKHGRVDQSEPCQDAHDQRQLKHQAAR